MKLLFAWRYFKAKKTTQAINIIAWISVIAITVITASFIVLLSVFNGFEGLVKSLYSSFYADFRVSPVSGKTLVITDSQKQQIQAIKGIHAVSCIVEEKALLKNGDYQTIVFVKGVDEQYSKVTGVASKMIRGTYVIGSEDQPALVMGVGIEQSVAADVERGIYPLMLYVFRSGVPLSVMDPYQSFSTDRITGAGTFLIQQDIDQKYAITNLAFMKRMVNLPEDQYSSVEIALTDPEMEATVQANLSKLLGAGYKIESRYQQNKNLYAVMRMEKWAIYGILFLMLIVAAFTLIGSLSMLVMEKRKDIQILKALGASHTLIQGIFINEGFLLGGIGTFGGILLGLLVCWIQIKFQLIGIQGGTFLINAYPVKVRFFDLLIVASTVMGVCYIASWLPIRRAVKYDKD